jgi:hypothetical protein
MHDRHGGGDETGYDARLEILAIRSSDCSVQRPAGAVTYDAEYVQ